MGLSLYISLCCLGSLITNPFLGAKAASCPRDWLQEQGNCYGYFDRKVSWNNAELECQSYGPGCHLASILSMQENDLVSAYITDQQDMPSNVWIGLRDLNMKGRWRWADESIFRYQAWIPGHPVNPTKNKHCAEVARNWSFKKWNDTSCGTFKPYICKYKL